MPWFVSDVTPADFLSTIPSLLSESFFSSAPDSSSVSADDHTALNAMVSRWKTYLESGAFALAVPPETPLGGTAEVNDHVQFWTGPWAYWELQAKAPTLFRELQESQLVIFKVCDSYQESMSFVMLMSGQGDLKCARVSIFRSSRFVCFKY